MVKRINYPVKFETVIKYLKAQIYDSVKQLEEDYPPGFFRSAGDIWNTFKPRICYKNDPKVEELFQCYETLFYNNVHGRSGAGDCDCFSILAVAAAISSGLPYTIVLASRVRDAPVHIYVEIEGVVVDFTRSALGSRRYYPFIQRFSF